eukprot:582877-Amphidinium_carterae.1
MRKEALASGVGLQSQMTRLAVVAVKANLPKQNRSRCATDFHANKGYCQPLVTRFLILLDYSCTTLPSGAELLPTGQNYGGIIFCKRYSYRYRKIF